MRSLRVIFLFVLVVFIGWGIYGLAREHNALESDLYALRARADAIKNENKLISEKIDFFRNPDNLIKELKSQTNVVNPGETLVIIVPPKATSSKVDGQEKR